MTVESHDPGARDAAHFLTTRWSLVRSARGDDPAARRGLGELCQAYWYPLYAYLRRRGSDHHQAQDLVQAFFLSLMERADLDTLEPDKGRFRGWLLTALRHFTSNQRAHDQAAKRGGPRPPLSIDFELARDRWHAEPAVDRSPESEFDRAWALETLQRARARLREEYAARGKQELFEALVGELEQGEAGKDRRVLGQELGLREGALKVAVHRLRQRFGEAVRKEIAETLGEVGGGEVDRELEDLIGALGGEG